MLTDYRIYMHSSEKSRLDSSSDFSACVPAVFTSCQHCSRLAGTFFELRSMLAVRNPRRHSIFNMPMEVREWPESRYNLGTAILSRQDWQISVLTGSLKCVFQWKNTSHREKEIGSKVSPRLLLFRTEHSFLDNVQTLLVALGISPPCLNEQVMWWPMPLTIYDLVATLRLSKLPSPIYPLTKPLSTQVFRSSPCFTSTDCSPQKHSVASVATIITPKLSL